MLYLNFVRAILNPKLEAGAGLGHARRLTKPADILIPSWSISDKPAAIDVFITSPLKSSILSEAGVVACAAARQTEERKYTCRDPICSELGWKCVPLVVETFDAGGKTADQFFAQLAVRLQAQGNSTKATMLNSIYGRLSFLLVRANARAFIARSISEATTTPKSKVVAELYAHNSLLLVRVNTRSILARSYPQTPQH